MQIPNGRGDILGRHKRKGQTWACPPGQIWLVAWEPSPPGPGYRGLPNGSLPQKTEPLPSWTCFIRASLMSPHAINKSTWIMRFNNDFTKNAAAGHDIRAKIEEAAAVSASC